VAQLIPQAAALLCLCAAGAAPAAAAAPLTPFRAADWEVQQGKWRFEPSGELVSEGGAHSAAVLWKGGQPRDLDFEVELMFPRADASAGLTFRGVGTSFPRETFYQYEWYTRGSHHDKRLSLMVKNPKWVQIVTPAYPEAPIGRWLRLRVRAQGDRIDCYLDGKLVFRTHDRRYLRPGRVGLHVFMPRPVRFRGFRLTEPPAE
jgi:hypothetical protein